MDYEKILNRAWKITWNYRALWLFGLLAALNIQVRLNLRNLPPSIQQWLKSISSHPAFVPVAIGLLVLLFLLALVLSILNALGRAALIDQVNRIEEGGTATIGSGWAAGRQYVWRIFAISFLLGLPVLVIIVAGVLPLVPILESTQDPHRILSEAMTFFLVCSMPACCAGTALAIVLSTIRQLAERACVLEGQSVWRSMVRGWELLRSHLGPIAVLWLVQVGIHIGATSIVTIPICLLALAIAVPVVFLAEASAPAGLAALCGIGLLFWLIGTALGSVIATFFSTYWTLGYRELRAVNKTVVEAETT